jgi:hypothetical protein
LAAQVNHSRSVRTGICQEKLRACAGVVFA